MMRPTVLAPLAAACALAACQTPAPPAPSPVVQAPPPAPTAGDDQDPNLKALPTTPVGRQALPPPAPR